VPAGLTPVDARQPVTVVNAINAMIGARMGENELMKMVRTRTSQR
jgi:hypothetical protein